MPIIAQKYPENFPKLSRKFHVFLPGETYLSSMHAGSDAMRASWRDEAEPCSHDLQGGGEDEEGALEAGPSEDDPRQAGQSC